MKKALRAQKSLVVEIIRTSFDRDPGVNYLIPQDQQRGLRIKNLIDHCVEVALRTGEIFLSDDDKAAALLLYPEVKLNWLAIIKLDIKVVWNALGIGHIFRALNREALVKKKRPKKDITYLWFIGVNPDSQGQGHGRLLLSQIIDYSAKKGKPLYLECSPQNLGWYQKLGFEVYDEFDEPPFQYFMRTRHF